MATNHFRVQSEHLTRREALKALGIAFAGVFAGACAGAPNKTGASEPSATGDFSARFAAFEPANEPDVLDLSNVSWPDFVTRAGPEVKGLYEYQVQHGE